MMLLRQSTNKALLARKEIKDFMSTASRFFSLNQRKQPEPQAYIPSEGSASDLDADDVLRAKIDPMKGQVYDFLRNVNVYEE